jgi:hypothetical protein
MRPTAISPGIKRPGREAVLWYCASMQREGGYGRLGHEEHIAPPAGLDPEQCSLAWMFTEATEFCFSDRVLQAKKGTRMEFEDSKEDTNKNTEINRSYHKRND